MLGNVWEWTNSWYEKYPGSQHNSPKYGYIYRIIRGGSFLNNRNSCRIACRGRIKPEFRKKYLGFRLASDNYPRAILLDPQTSEELHDSQPQLSDTQFEFIPDEIQQEMPSNRILRQKVVDNFNSAELRTLAFDLGLYHDDFPDTRTEMARELLAACKRQGRMSQLIKIFKQERPNIEWG